MLYLRTSPLTTDKLIFNNSAGKFIFYTGSLKIHCVVLLSYCSLKMTESARDSVTLTNSVIKEMNINLQPVLKCNLAQWRN